MKVTKCRVLLVYLDANLCKCYILGERPKSKSSTMKKVKSQQPPKFVIAMERMELQTRHREANQRTCSCNMSSRRSKLLVVLTDYQICLLSLLSFGITLLLK